MGADPRQRGGTRLDRIERHGPLPAGDARHDPRHEQARAAAAPGHRERGLGGDRLPAVAGRRLHVRRLPAHRRRGAERQAHLARGGYRRQHRAIRRLSSGDHPQRASRLTVPTLDLTLDTGSEGYAASRAHALGLIAQWRAIEARTRAASARAQALFDKRGQLLPRERVARLLAPGVPFLELSTLAGWLQDAPDADRSIPGGGTICGIGVIAGTRVMLVADDAGIDAGALQPQGLEKLRRAQTIALENRLPFVHLVESAGANLMNYRVEQFIHGGSAFYMLARLSAAGLPVIAVVHGSSTAGGAYMTGLSDHVIMVRGRARAFLAGPPLLKAATGEIALEEALGGADMHASVSGLAEYVADDDAHALGMARELVNALGWQPRASWPDGPAPKFDAEELLGLFATDMKKP